MANLNSQYSFNLPRRQSLSLPYDVVNFILNNCASPKVFSKLQKTCKHFFNQKKVVVVDDRFVRILSRGEIYLIKTNVSRCHSLNQNFQYWLTDGIEIWNAFSNLNAGRSLTKYLKYFYRCNLTSLEIFGENLTFKETDFLLNGGKIENLKFYHLNIRYEDGTPVTIDIILEKCPNIRDFCYDNRSESFSSQTFIKLNRLKFNKKFSKFCIFISKIERKIIPQTLSNFIKKNVAYSAGPLVYFPQDFPQTDLDEFRINVKQILKNDFAKIYICRMWN